MNFRIFIGEDYKNFHEFVKGLEEQENNFKEKWGYVEKGTDAYILLNQEMSPTKIIANKKYSNVPINTAILASNVEYYLQRKRISERKVEITKRDITFGIEKISNNYIQNKVNQVCKGGLEKKTIKWIK